MFTFLKKNKNDKGELTKKSTIIKSPNSVEEKINMLIEKTPSISLLENEVCYYEEKAKAYHEKMLSLAKRELVQELVSEWQKEFL